MLDWLFHKKPALPGYTAAQEKAVRLLAEEQIGEIMAEMPEEEAKDLRVKLLLTEPHADAPYFTAVTCGAGALEMKLPDELKEECPARAEYMLSLPPDWDITNYDQRWSWPFSLLFYMAHYPPSSGYWIDMYSALDMQEMFADNVGFRGVTVALPQFPGVRTLQLPAGETVCFYRVVPLYANEADFLNAYGPEPFAEYVLPKIPCVLDINRENVCGDWLRRIGTDGKAQLDNASFHIIKVREKKLQTDELNAYTHPAVFLRWCMLKGFMSGLFRSYFAEECEAELQHKDASALRLLLRDKLAGMVHTAMLTEEAAAFAGWAYIFTEDPEEMKHSYPVAVDEYTYAVFGKERCLGPELQDEGYLFLPCDEALYTQLAARLDELWAQWKQGTAQA